MIADLAARVQSLRLMDVLGKVSKVVGLTVEATGLNTKIGDLCIIESQDGVGIEAEIVGFRNELALLMPLGELSGVRAGCHIRSTGAGLRVPVGRSLFGRTLNGIGRPIDGLGSLADAQTYPLAAPPPNPLKRSMIERPFLTGVRAIDGLFTMGEGQRMGIFAGSGVGKSTLMGMIARNGNADVNVIALVGERGRELREFMQNDLGDRGMQRSVLVCATSDEPALVRIKAAFSATAIAEYFRDQGLSVMLMMDSVTRFAMAQREVGLAIGEPPSTKGYTPSVFAMLPRLMERAGCGERGSITGIYTVLVEGDDTSEPIADASRAILDGHIVLSRKLTSAGHYPPIDVGESLSRLMPMVTDPSHVQAANAFRELIGAYAAVEDLVSIGAYKSGSQPKSDRAIERWDAMNAFLRQPKDGAALYSETRHKLGALTDA